ncbi:hypothetical protein K737_300513 [Holospora undulata HU1]|uniref:Type II secretion system protein GspC N-terminal domain-containing protein n=3 Tax=Holospora TaxID=44747 RepID=A0A061JHU8_9PROT|nr:hypothetical protein [Holospora elegans]ETZ05062.1 hypothetical protein K737_300513 [Holospora undulata HU1]GAJ46005.1 hypothetical protein HE1_00325 [Holospora elegans E1]
MWMLGLSLFFTHPYTFEKKHPSSSEQVKPSMTVFVLQGIFLRPDTQEWIVWINDHRLDHLSQRSLHGWYVLKVDAHYVVLENSRKQRITLQLKQSVTVPEG